MSLSGNRWMCVAASLLLPSYFCSQEVILPPGKDFPFHAITYLGVEQGLSHPAVSWITQDSLGFMWFITQNGLNRYNGYEFRSWTYENGDPHSLPVGDYYAMAVDPAGHIWIPQLYEGVYSFDPQCEEFTRHLSPLANEGIVDNMALVAESNGIIWIGTAGGLKKYNPSTLQVNFFRQEEGDSTTLSNNHIYGLVLDEHDDSSQGINLWIINTDFGIDGFNTHTGKVIRQYRFPFPRSEYIWSPNGIMNILGKRNETIWIGSNDNAIFGFNTKTERFTRIPMERPCRSASHIIGLYTVMEDRKGNLWTLNDNNEIIYFERKTNLFFYYSNLPSHISLVQADCVMYEDNNHRIWIGTRRGIVTIDTRNNAFHTIQVGEPGTSSGNDVTGILPSSGNKILLSTGILSELDKETGSVKPLEHSNSWAAENALQYMNRDRQGLIWIPGYRRIISYDPETQITRDYPLFDSAGIEYEGFRGVIQDLQGNYWTYGFVGILRFDPGERTAQNNTGRIGPDNVKHIINAFLDSRGQLFFSWRHGQGLLVYDPLKDICKVYDHDPLDPSTISINMPTVYLEDKYGHIWVGTEGGGINVFDPITERFRAFTTKDGFAHDYVQSITQDTSSRIWAGTLQGISSYIPPEDPFNADGIAFRNYSVGDGLPSDMCLIFSAYCDKDGTLYFGTAGGKLVYFHPSDLAGSVRVPPVYLTALHVNNKPVSVRDTQSILTQSIEYTDEIRLTHTQNILAFSFASLNYFNPEKNQYAYQLTGYDKNWIHTNADNRRATYTNLDPGEYVFKVKGSNNDGLWNDIPRELKIIIIPAFWQTTWFKLLVVLAAGALIYAIYRYRLRQVLKLHAMRNRIAHDLHDNIGSTLNSISIYSEVAQHKSEGKIPELDLIGESSRRVIDAMSDIVWTINPDNDSFSKIIFRMHSQTHYLMKAKGIDYSFKVDEGFDELSLPMQTRQNFYLIYKEAVNNLLKYSQATAVDITMSHTGNLVKLRIHDNGVGFHVDQANTGNGMQSMKQRAKAIKADFTIDSKPGEGTSVVLQMMV